jgi:dihydroneopterin aldolase
LPGIERAGDSAFQPDLNDRKERRIGDNAPHRMTGRIHLKNMEFHGFHGCHPGEEVVGQRFLVDLVLTADLSRAAATDELVHAVDYERIYETCRRVVERGRNRLMETLCRRICDALLEEWPQVQRVDLMVKKPVAPIRGSLDYVAVEVSRERGNRAPRARK